MLGQNRHQPQDQRQLAIVGSGEIEANGALAEGFGTANLGIIRAVIRATFVAQQLPGEDHVLGGDRMSVGEFCSRIERERRVAARRIGFARDQTPAFRRGRVGVAKMRETGGERRTSVHGDRMGGLGAEQGPRSRAG